MEALPRRKRNPETTVYLSPDGHIPQERRDRSLIKQELKSVLLGKKLRTIFLERYGRDHIALTCIWHKKVTLHRKENDFA